MFKSLFDKIVGKISDLNPIKHFIKYAIDKTLNEFLQKELTLEDFRNGPLNLENIAINTDKINKSYLIGSPYVMHYGMIKNLNISLPPLSEISTQSISIAISGIEITLKPNKNFSKNFKEQMVELHEHQKENEEEKEAEGEISESGPMDFFKELLKKIIMNIKVEISNIAIKLYMNTPSENKENNTQFFLMLRVPLIHVNKKEDKEKIKNDVEDIRFSITLPQISLHLLREDMKYPDYSNVKCEAGDFPFKYPGTDHPSTILLIGDSILPDNIQSKISEWKNNGNMNAMKEFSQMTFRLTTDYKKKVKEVKLSFEIPNFQIMISPIQIKVLSRFVAQIMEFKKILDSIMTELKTEANESLYLTKKKSLGVRTSASNDLFSSIMMSFSGDHTSVQNPVIAKENKDIFQSMISEDKIMRESVRSFNLEFQQKMKEEKKSESSSISVDFQVINFQQAMKLDIRFLSLRAYLLKYSTNQEYYRKWLSVSETNEHGINKKIGCDYFMFAINEIDVATDVKEKTTEVKIKNLKLYNVKLHDLRNQNSVDEFFDISASVDFSVSIDSSRKLHFYNDIKEYEIDSQSHFCVEELLSVSQNESALKKHSESLNIKMKEDVNIKKHCLLPELNYSNEDNYVLFKHGISLDIKNKDKFIKLSLEIVTVSLNLELFLDFLNIWFPLMGCRRLASVINFKRNEISKSNNLGGKAEQKRNIFESSYEPVEDVEEVKDLKSESKNNLIIEVSELKIGFRKGETCESDGKNSVTSNFGHLVSKEKEKLYEEELFSKVCFCDLNEIGIYLEVQGLLMSKKFSQIKVHSKIVDIGIIQIKNSKITSLSSIFSIKSTKNDEKIRLSSSKIHTENLSVFIPELTGKFSEEDIISIASLAVESIKIIDQLMIYKDYLEKEMKLIEQHVFEASKKAKKCETTVEKEFKIYIDRIFIEFDYCQLLAEQTYFNITQHSEDNFTCKISKLIAGIKKSPTLRVGLCEHINEVACTKYYEKFDHKGKKGIEDEDIIFEMGNDKDNHFGYKIAERENFFLDLDNHNFNLVLNFAKRDMERCLPKFTKKESGNDVSKMKWGGTGKNNLSNGTLSQKFKFQQKPYNLAIEEEGLKKVIDISIENEIRVYACNILEVGHHTKKIEQIGNYIKIKINEAEEKLKSQTISLMERKHSVEIESESLEINIKLNSPILLEIRPDFIRNQKEKIYSNMRSVISLNFNNDLSVLINKDKNQKEVIGEVSLSYYFLKHEDRETELNPIRMPKIESLGQLGFKKILEINHLFIKACLLEENKNLNIKVKELFGELSLETICFLELHYEHFINHHVKNEMGKTFMELFTGDEFEELICSDYGDIDLTNEITIITEESEDDVFIIEDLTGAEEAYREKLIQKEKDDLFIKNKTMTFTKCKNPKISIEGFEIENICVRVNNNRDFNFVASKGGTESRSRMKHNFDINCYSLMGHGISVIFDFEEDEVSLKEENDQKIMLENQNQEDSKIKIMNLLLNIESLNIFSNKEKGPGQIDLKHLKNLSTDGAFIILENEKQLCILFEQSNTKTVLKSYNLRLNVGVTTDIIDLFKLVEKTRREVSKSCWKKVYDSKESEKETSQINIKKIGPSKEGKKILVYLPESSLKLSFRKFGIKIIDEQTILMKEFLLNEELENEYQIKAHSRKWFYELMKNNIGGLIGGTALKLLFKLFSQIISLNMKWLSIVFGFFFQFPE